MNEEPPKFRYYKIEGPILEILKAYKAELGVMAEERMKLEQEYMERARQQSEYHQANLHIMWRRMAASVGLDPDTTWGSPEYQIEARYIDDGFGALLYVPRHTNPLRDMLGGEPVAEPQNPETDIPDDKTTRH
jgi:hypothetical protein